MAIVLETAGFYLFIQCDDMVTEEKCDNLFIIAYSRQKIGVPEENHRPVASHWQTLSYNVVSSTTCHEGGSKSQL
jgi:hypothetical protein